MPIGPNVQVMYMQIAGMYIIPKILVFRNHDYLAALHLRQDARVPCSQNGKFENASDSKYNEPGSPEESFHFYLEPHLKKIKKINFFYGFSMIELGLCETAKYIACRHMCCSASMPAEA